MPRPGPRPYECVRRAWHGDRHQPIRGTLIQEIFRMAHEVHSVGTRKNKEWQEKLPFVVLKAEEIMYSKANSEAEYMEFTTLWERTNDAVDTIIRRDESEESANLLKPCIEAALNLGCIPRRASRSQRHNSPRCYLSSVTQEPVGSSTFSPIFSDGTIGPPHQGIPFNLPLPVTSSGILHDGSQQFVGWYSSLGVPLPVNSGSLGTRTVSLSQELGDSVLIPHHQHPVPFIKVFHSNQDRHMSAPACTWSTGGHVFPLHYRENQQNIKSPVSRHNSVTGCQPQDSLPISHHELPLLSVEISDSDQEKDPALNFEDRAWSSTGDAYPLCYYEGLPKYGEWFSHHNSTNSSCRAVAAETCFLHNFLPDYNADGASTETSNLGNLYQDTLDLKCDLSLHLGPSSIRCLGGGSVWSHEVEDVGSSSSHSGDKFRNMEGSPGSLSCL